MHLIHRLPTDLHPLILRHWAASVLQCHLVRWHRYRHVRRRSWAQLRGRLPRSVHALLVRHAGIRREWYCEPGSWLAHTDDDLHTVVAEVEAGWWGRALVV